LTCATPVRALLLSAALFASALTPVRCLGEDGTLSPARSAAQDKATQELPPELLSLLQQKSMPKHSPIILRVFKEESELEVWKQDTTGHFQLLKTYPVCRWSGDLGPKQHEGDRQTPEGFYTITPALMNPNSEYYLAINTGFPNSFDKANDRDGSFLMIHGDCWSSGCYAMTDEQIAEIYALARDALAGRPSFQVQAYPFRMTPANLARHRTSPYLAFWQMLKIGNDHFETTHLEPKVDVCDRRYVFDANPPPHSSKPLVFDPAAQCPAYVVNPKIAQAALAKQDADDAEYAKLVKDDAPAAPVYSGLDGGMNKVFLIRYPWRIIPLARVLPPTGIQLPDMPPVPWTDNASSLTSEFFGGSPASLLAAQTQVASTASAPPERGADSAASGSASAPALKADAVDRDGRCCEIDTR
jgi:murein L,D-transpeptidase YafK